MIMVGNVKNQSPHCLILLHNVADLTVPQHVQKFNFCSSFFGRHLEVSLGTKLDQYHAKWINDRKYIFPLVVIILVKIIFLRISEANLIIIYP